MKHLIITILFTLSLFAQEIGVPYVPEAIPEITSSMIAPKGTYISNLSYLEKKKLLIAGNSKGVVSFITLSPLHKVAEIRAHDVSITAMAVTQDEKYLITAGQDNGLKLWDIESKQFLGIFETHGMPILGLVVTPDSKTLITVDACVNLVYWDLDSRKIVKKTTVNSLRGFPENIDLCVSYQKRKESSFRDFKISHNGKYIAIAGNPWLVVLDTNDYRVIRTSDLDCKFFNGQIEFSEDDKAILYPTSFKQMIDGSRYCGGDLIKGLQLAANNFLDDTHITQIMPIGTIFTNDKNEDRFVSYHMNHLGIARNFQSESLPLITTKTPSSSNIVLSGDLIFAGFDDEVIKFYSFEKGSEVATFFNFYDGEWVAIRSDGYFDTSNNGREHIKMLNNMSKIETIDLQTFQKYNTQINLGEK